MEGLPQNKKIVLFDGFCNLCDSSVQFIIRHDKNDVFRFLPLQSELGQQVIRHIGIDTAKTDSIILYEPGISYHYKADAAITIAKTIGGIYSLLGLFSWLPKPITNAVYDYVAKNRYKWYGKKEQCMLPSPEIKAKFL